MRVSVQGYPEYKYNAAACPQCGKIGRVVSISQDWKRAGIQCPGSHSQMSRGDSKFGSAARPQTRSGKNMVFLVKTKR